MIGARVGLSLALAVVLQTGCVWAQEKPSGATSRQDASTSDATTEKPGHAGYVGDAACGACHRDKFETFQLTAHHRTSQLPSAASIDGKFTPPGNIMRTADPGLSFRMDARNGGFYQTAVFGEPPHAKEHSEEFGIVVGSGGKGQTYLYWRGDGLFQLPVSYWTQLGQWVNSPGYLDGTADFDRAVIPRCLECHATYFETLAPARLKNRYDRTNFVLGISCERCHGPGEEHVSQERSATAASSGDAPAIANPGKLPRDRQMDVCAQCHAGAGDSIAPAFSFQPGESLANFISLQKPAADGKVDVHGNQVALLERSKCYQSSANLTCATCHDEHAPERSAASYSSRCLTCHAAEKCGMFAKLGAKIAENCIDCHMPLQESNLIVSDVDGREVKARVRNHWIKIYGETSGR
ncbi:MAG: multiheme c-type cytochrome [Candidatus Acidiferrum sp.]